MAPVQPGTGGVPMYSPLPVYSRQPAPTAAATASAKAAVPLPTLLVAGTTHIAPDYVPALREQFRVVVATGVAEAIAAVEQERPVMIIADAALRDGTAATICASTRTFDSPATVLVVTGEPEAAPDALAAGCDGVLLAPFAPNLLYARVGRLMRERVRDLRMRANVRVKVDPAAPRTCGTNHHWPYEVCPECRATGGVTSFEFHSHRRAWFACVQCRKVWIGRRLEDF